MAFYELAMGKKFDVADSAFFKSLYEVFESAPHSYSLTEKAWGSFLASARASGSPTIIISSRSFFTDGADAEPARIKFFTDLGFAREHLLYSGSADDCKKDVTLHKWLADKPEITHIVFIDNLRAHCVEITESLLLAKYTRTAFEHNAYLRYFERFHLTILHLQLQAAHDRRVRLTDAEILLCKDVED